MAKYKIICEREGKRSWYDPDKDVSEYRDVNGRLYEFIETLLIQSSQFNADKNDALSERLFDAYNGFARETSDEGRDPELFDKPDIPMLTEKGESEITRKDIDYLKRHERAEAEEPAMKPKKPKSGGNGNRGRILGTARLYLFYHFRNERHWEKRHDVPNREVLDFMEENGNAVREAARYAGKKTCGKPVLLPATWIGGYYLLFRMDFKKPERLIKLFFDGILDEANTDNVLSYTRHRIKEAGKLARCATPPTEVRKALLEGFLEFSK